MSRKPRKIFLQGIKNGCVRCLNEYSMQILFDGATIENRNKSELTKDNIYLHLALPLVLEGAIRGYQDAIILVCGIYRQIHHETEDVSRYGHSVPATPLIMYWKKNAWNDDDRERRAGTKQNREDMKEHHGTFCSVCKRMDSATVTLRKCDGCRLYFYCSKECQQNMWLEGQHAGVCRQLGILQKYHKPFAKKIRKDLTVHGIAPRDIPELQELRQRLGLSRPQSDYQESLDAAQALRLDPAKLLFPRKDGTVQIGSFPRPL